MAKDMSGCSDMQALKTSFFNNPVYKRLLVSKFLPQSHLFLRQIKVLNEKIVVPAPDHYHGL